MKECGFEKKAAEALGKIKDARAVEPLIKALKGEDKEVQKEAAKALFLLEKISVDEYHETLKLCKPAEERVKSILRALKNKDRFIRTEAEKDWEKIKEDGGIVEPLIQALKDEDVGLRRRVVEALGNIGDARAVEPLIKVLKDEHAGVRKGAVIALGKLGDAGAVAPLLEYMFINPDDTMEQEVKALRKIASNSNLTEEIIGMAAEAAKFKTFFFEETGDNPLEYLEDSNRVVKTICSNKSPVMTNILILISQRSNISVTMYSGPDDRWEKMVDFSKQRQMAMDELAQRGSPPYDPSVFLKSSE